MDTIQKTAVQIIEVVQTRRLGEQPENVEKVEGLRTNQSLVGV